MATPLKYTMISPVVTISQEVMEKKRIKTKIGVGYVVKTKVGEMEDKIREERIRRNRKKVVGFVQDVAGKNKCLVQFKDGKNKEMSSCLILYLC